MPENVLTVEDLEGVPVEDLRAEVEKRREQLKQIRVEKQARAREQREGAAASALKAELVTLSRELYFEKVAEDIISGASEQVSDDDDESDEPVPVEERAPVPEESSAVHFPDPFEDDTPTNEE